MPTVIQRDGFRVVIFLPPREHGPAHVHVRKAGTEVVITLDPIGIRVVERMRAADVVQAVRLVEDNRAHLLKEWRKRHV